MLHILVIGAGMYVCGRGTADFGTILPAITEWRRGGVAGEVLIAGTSADSAAGALDRAAMLARRTGVALSPAGWPRAGASRQAYRDAIAALPRPGCAIVAVPDHLHHEVASATIDAGLPTLLVKPMTPTVVEAVDLIARAERHRVYAAIEFHKRQDRANLRLRDAIQSGVIGRPLAFQVQYSQRYSVPSERFRAWAAQTNTFQYLGVHYVDIIQFVTGAAPIAAAALGQKHRLADDGIDTYDAVEAMIEWQLPGGQRFGSVFVTSWVDPESTSAMSDQRIMVIGTHGRYESDQKRRGIQLNTVERGVEEPNPDFCCAYGTADGEVRYQGYGIDSVTRFLRDAASLAAGATTPERLDDGVRPTFRAALPSVQVVEAVSQSLAGGGERVAIAPAAVSA